MGLCLHEIPKVPFCQQKTIPLSLVQNETYRREVAVHVARLLAALHPHSTPHPPSQLGPCTRVPAPGSQPAFTSLRCREAESRNSPPKTWVSASLSRPGRREQAEIPEILRNQQKQTLLLLPWYHILTLTRPTLHVCSETSRPLLTTDQETQLQAPTQLENKALWVEWVDGLIPSPSSPHSLTA